MTKHTRTRPSEIIGLDDEWAAYQFDSAVVTFGTIIDNLLEMTENIGSQSRPRYAPKYRLVDLLEHGFKVTKDGEPIDTINVFDAIEGIEYEEID